MYLKTDQIDISLGGVSFRTYKRNTDWELTLDPSAIDGWYDGVNTRRDAVPRPNQWGDFSEPARKGSRLISLSGTATAQTPTLLQTARDKFAGILQAGGYSEMRVRSDAEDRYITVGIEGKPNWVRMGDTIAVWKLDLIAPNPRVFGPKLYAMLEDNTQAGGLDFPIMYPIDFGGAQKNNAVYIANSGNVDSWPLFTVTGDYPSGFHLKNNKGSIVSYLGLVSSRSPVTIDMAAGTAMQNGQDRSVNLSRRDWFSIPPASSIRPSFEPIQDGTGWCDIIYRDTWI